jgi:hypothetical protein
MVACVGTRQLAISRCQLPEKPPRRHSEGPIMLAGCRDQQGGTAENEPAALARLLSGTGRGLRPVPNWSGVPFWERRVRHCQGRPSAFSLQVRLLCEAGLVLKTSQ